MTETHAPPTYTLITTQRDLVKLQETMTSHKRAPIYIDTEFKREKTYAPILSLIQLNFKERIYIIDALALQHEVHAFIALLNEPDWMKVYHSGTQDIEVMHYITPSPQQNLFDTQIAARLAGMKEQISLFNLVKDICNLELDKSAQQIDWCMRPLPPAALDYAAADVAYLPAIYAHLESRLQQKNRLAWAFEEAEKALSPTKVIPQPIEAWRRLRLTNAGVTNAPLVVAMAAARELLARELDLPRAWIFADSVFDTIASAKTSIQALTPQTIKRFDEDIVDSVAEQLAHYVQQLEDESISQATTLLELERRAPAHNEVYDMLKILLNHYAAQVGLNVSVLSSTKELKRLVNLWSHNHPAFEDSPLLNGWRERVVGRPIRAFLKGDLNIKLADNKVIFEEKEA